MPDVSILTYLDTNVYSRPFDDQTRSTIQREANAFLQIMDMVKTHKLRLLSSDILMFEVENILSEEKRTKIRDYLKLCMEHIDNSAEILCLGKQIEEQCATRARDALHIASAILGRARYCLSCDRNVTAIAHTRCYRRLGKTYRQDYLSVMNPIRFIEKFK